MLSRSVLVFAAVTIVGFVVFVFAASRIDVLLLMLVLGALSTSGSVFLAADLLDVQVVKKDPAGSRPPSATPPELR